MSENCNQSCSSCSEDCAERKEQKTDFSEKPHEMSSIKRFIGIVSGKGGVGRSLVISMLAVTMNRMGYHTAILDADIIGPSIPKAFGIKEKASGSEFGLFPVKTKISIDIMSVNLLLENDTEIVSKAVKMAGIVNIPIIGLVENMSYFKCLDNGKDYQVFGESHIEEIVDKHNLKLLAKLPIDSKISAACDKGMIELFDGNWFEAVAVKLERMEEN